MKKAKHTEKEITIVGVVEEYEEEEDTGLIIATDDDDYVVELNKQGKRLSQEVGMDVEATGFVTKNGDGTKRISVTKFEVFESDDDDDEDEMFYDDDDDEIYDDDDDDDTRRW
jgi:predicted ATP-grasp superfamily ATP-dependent carboligase